METKVEWKGQMKFIGTAGSGHPVTMDAAPEVGGSDSGTRPKELLLNGLAGCTGMDVISILEKMKIRPESFRIEVEAEQTEEHPKVFKKIHMVYYVKGDVPEDKLKKAIGLSQQKYCGVGAMLKQGAQLTYEYKFE
jgi:putative redox protein